MAAQRSVSPITPSIHPHIEREQLMKSIPIIRFAAALALTSVACSRDLPSEWPDNSPASSAAQELPNANVTLALDGDPPLPGEPAEGWIGLEQVPAEDPHAHHRHHGNHGKPEPEPEPKHEGHEGHGGHHGH